MNREFQSGHSALDCREIFAALSEYLDGDLPQEMCQQVEAHMEDCAPCIEFLRSLRESIELSRQLNVRIAPPPVPDGVKTRLLEAWREALSRRQNAGG